MRKSTVVVLIVLALVLATGLEAQEKYVKQNVTGPDQGRQNVFRVLTGISVTPTSVVDYTVDFDITLNTDGSPRGYWNTTTTYGRTVGDYLGNLGSVYSFQTYGGFGTPAFVTLTLANPQVNAVAFGYAGSAPVAATTIPVVTPGTPGQFRGSFQHTYGAAGRYDLTVGAAFNFNATNATTAPFTFTAGNPVQVMAGENLSWTSVFRFFGPASTNTLAFTYSGAAGANQTVGLTNVITSGGQQGVLVPQQAQQVVAIPTVSEIGLALLALLLAAAGVLVLKR